MVPTTLNDIGAGIVLMIVALFAVFAASSHKAPASFGGRFMGRKPREGFIDKETGFIVVEGKLVSPAKAAAMNVKIMGYYTPPKKADPPASSRPGIRWKY